MIALVVGSHVHACRHLCKCQMLREASMDFVIHRNTLRASSVCKQPSVPAAVTSGVLLCSEVLPSFPTGPVFSGSQPRVQELEEEWLRGCGGGSGPIGEAVGQLSVGEADVKSPSSGPLYQAACLCPCVREWGATPFTSLVPQVPRELVYRWLLGNRWF